MTETNREPRVLKNLSAYEADIAGESERQQSAQLQLAVEGQLHDALVRVILADVSTLEDSDAFAVYDLVKQRCYEAHDRVTRQIPDFIRQQLAEAAHIEATENPGEVTTRRIERKLQIVREKQETLAYWEVRLRAAKFVYAKTVRELCERDFGDGYNWFSENAPGDWEPWNGKRENVRRVTDAATRLQTMMAAWGVPASGVSARVEIKKPSTKKRRASTSAKPPFNDPIP